MISEPIINFIKTKEIVKNISILIPLKIIVIFLLYQLVLITITTLFGELIIFFHLQKYVKKILKN